MLSGQNLLMIAQKGKTTRLTGNTTESPNQVSNFIQEDAYSVFLMDFVRGVSLLLIYWEEYFTAKPAKNSEKASRSDALPLHLLL